METQVKLTELVAAFDWVSAAGPFENAAYVNRETGAIHWSSSMNELDEELPDDIEDGTRYLAVPHKNELGLGRDLALRFVEENVPNSYELASSYFRKRGAYGRFKDLLERQGCIESWYQYEAEAVEQALREWCRENGLQVSTTEACI